MFGFTTYSYDTRDQLTGATDAAIAGLTPPAALPAAESYSFDTTGNRLLAGGTSSSASGTFNRVQNDGTYTYDYDAEGNQIRRTHSGTGAVTEYEYDYRNRLVKVTERGSVGGAATQIVEYQYGALDRRTGKELDSDADGVVDRREAWAWDADQVLLQLVDADGDGAGSWKLADRYLYGAVLDMVLADEQLPGGGIALNSVSSTAGTVLWPLGDQLGSVRDLVDSNGVIRQHVVYDNFGQRLSETDFDSAGTSIASNNPAAVDTLFGFTGRDWDADTELQYNRARWYDPAQGRWESQDPISFAAGDVNLYRVVGNHVTGATDPDGLKEYVITIHYYLPTLGMNPAVEQEVNRILQNAFKKHASKEHSLKIMFKKLNSAKEFDDQECGVTGTGFFDWYPDGINGKFHEAPGLDKFGEGKVGQGRGFSGGVGPKSLGRFRGDRNRALAAVIVHEVIFHGVHVHYLLSDAHIHKTGFIDAETPKVGGELSDEACKLLIKKLKAE